MPSWPITPSNRRHVVYASQASRYLPLLSSLTRRTDERAPSLCTTGPVTVEYAEVCIFRIINIHDNRTVATPHCERPAAGAGASLPATFDPLRRPRIGTCPKLLKQQDDMRGGAGGINASWSRAFFSRRSRLLVLSILWRTRSQAVPRLLSPWWQQTLGMHQSRLQTTHKRKRAWCSVR